MIVIAITFLHVGVPGVGALAPRSGNLLALVVCEFKCPPRATFRSVSEKRRCFPLNFTAAWGKLYTGAFPCSLVAAMPRWEAGGNNLPRFSAAVSALWQGRPTLPPSRPEVSEPNRRPETFGHADGGDPSGVGRPARARGSIREVISVPFLIPPSTDGRAVCGLGLATQSDIARRRARAQPVGA